MSKPEDYGGNYVLVRREIRAAYPLVYGIADFK